MITINVNFSVIIRYRTSWSVIVIHRVTSICAAVILRFDGCNLVSRKLLWDLCRGQSCGKTTKMFPHYETRDLKSLSKENVKSSQLTRLLVPASCHDHSWIVAHFNLAPFIFPTILSVGRRPAESLRKEESTHVTPTFECKVAGPGCSKARDSAILLRINHYPEDKNLSTDQLHYDPLNGDWSPV